MPDPGGGPGPDGCATPTTGDWIGTASDIGHGAGSQAGTEADVRWTFAERVGCVDHYRPSGTARDAFEVGCCCDLRVEPRSSAISPLDGELVIDRSTSPATYRITGTTTWEGIAGCPGEETAATLGGEWVDAWGAFDGDVISGGLHTGSSDQVWTFTRVDASFTPPADCTVPPREAWSSTFTQAGSSRVATWIRTAARGCFYRYALCGDPVNPSSLTIDRSVEPPRFRVWFQDDPDVEVSGTLDGERFAGGATSSWDDVRVDWSFTKARCGSPDCFGPLTPSGGVAMTRTITGAVADDAWVHHPPVAVVPGSRFTAAVRFFDGAAHVFVRWNAEPNATAHDCQTRYGLESCDLDVPAAATTAYVSVFGWNQVDSDPQTPYELTVTWTRPP